jgi:hypothetical protein
MAITQSGSTLNGTGSIDLTSINAKYGYSIGVESGTATGTINGSTVSFNFSSSTVGSGSGNFDGTAISGTGTVGGVLNFGGFTFQGTLSGNTITGTFNFPTGGNGPVSVTNS